MKHILLLLLLFISSVSIRADRLMDIMRNYNAKTMSVAEMDSVLEAYPQPLPEGKGVSMRYKLEYKNENNIKKYSKKKILEYFWFTVFLIASTFIDC